MTTRNPVSSIQNSFFDSEQLDDQDLTLEQNYNNNFETGIVNNHIGSGVLPEVLNQSILFDSLLVSGLLDGTSIQPQNQPNDKNFGNQLEIELTDSAVAGKKSIKLAIIGLDFEGNLQFDTFFFRTNEKQITKRHYTTILTLLFNDFIGPSAQSFNLGGRIVIKEAKPFTLSRDPVMVAQDVEPNLFFRDFFVSNSSSLTALLQTALPLFNIDNLGINTGYKENKIIAKNDVSTQVGQKFLATTNNIQKVSLLLAVQNTDPGMATDLAWHGDLVVSIYPLQSSIQCPTDITPNLPIDFSPSNIPLAQISVNYTTLQAMGVTLDGNAQPVDFVFSNTPVANGNSIMVNGYYVVTVKRSGSADKCDILIATGSDHVTNSRVTIFTGSIWVDIPEEDLWYKIYTDAAKVSDGQAYETGHGIIIPKTKQDEFTNLTEDYSLDGVQFSGNELFTAVVSANIEKSTPIQDQRTGNPVFSRQQFIPDIKLLNPLDLNNLELSSEPFAIGNVSDKNKKSFDSVSSTLSASTHAWTFVKNQIVFKIIDDITDPRFDANINSLVSNLINGDFVNSKFIPDISNPSIFYRISKAELISMIYGDINGDGIIDDNDLVLYNKLLTSNLNSSPPHLSSTITDGYTNTTINGYQTYINPFVAANTLNFQIVDPDTDDVVAIGTDGILVADPNDLSLANFNSASTNFSLISDLTNLKLVIINSSNEQNNGSFFIQGVTTVSNNTVTLRKLYYTSDTLMQIMRADIDGDFIITENDGYLIQSYIQKSPPFPPTSLPSTKIGTQFNAIRLTVDPFIYKNIVSATPDRTDDFPASATNRATTLHTLQDIYLGDGYFASHDFLSSPISFNIDKQFSWEDYLISVHEDARFVPTIFSEQEGFAINKCTIEGIQYEVYPSNQEFDPGKINVFVPNDIILGGELTKPDGNFYKIDFEVGTIVLEIPDGFFGIERTINLFEDFITDYNNQGVTRLGFPAMRFADCSLVESDALVNNQVRFSVSVQSFSPNTNGIDADGYEGVIVDGKMGVSIDYSTGLLTLNFTNLYEDPVLSTLNTKVQVNVFLKKGGFNNLPVFVDSSKLQNMLQLVNVFNVPGGATGFTFDRIELVGGFQTWLLEDSAGQQLETANKYKIRTSSASTVQAFVPKELADDTLTAIEVVILAKNKNGTDSAKWVLHKSYSRYSGGSSNVLSGGPTDPLPDTFGAASGWNATIALIGNTWTVNLTGDTSDIDWTIDIDTKELS